MADDPSDLTNQFNTPLAPKDEAAYQTWAKKLGAQGNTYDYDLRGAFAAGAGQAANGHFPDTFKKPNHPTFSDQSQYSTPQMPGGQWQQQPDQSWSFAASPTNLQHHSPQELQDYFTRVEKGNTLKLPQAQPASMLDAVQKALKEFGVGETAAP